MARFWGLQFLRFFETGAIALTLLTSSVCYCQGTLRGRVMDKVTAEPVPFANVFFAYTTKGTSTNPDGTFVITQVPTGSYDLVVQVVGYEPYKQSVEIRDGESHVDIVIKEESTLLRSIEVVADQSDKQYYPLFVKFFIGESANARHCEIVNPENLHFFYDKDKERLSVSAARPIVVINRVLGHKVHYSLNRFTLDFKTGTKVLEGSPRFEELPHKEKRDSLSMMKKRDLAYLGSVLHLMRSIYQGSTAKDGFTFFEADSSNTHEAQRDRKKIEPNDYLTGDKVKKFAYNGLLKVKYRGKEEWNYPAKRQGPFRTDNPGGKQLTFVRLSSPSLTIYENGYYTDPHSVFLDGYLVWRETICNLVPISHEVMTKKKKRGTSK